MKNDKLYYLLLGLILAIPLGYLAISWAKIPEKVPMHFDLDGNVNRYGNKSELIFIVVFLSAIILFLQLLFKIDPKKESIEANKPKYRMMSLAIAAFMAFIQVEIIGTAINIENTFNSNITFAAIGLLMAVLGNYMQNIKPNYFMGIRTAWTLNNEEVWRRTHLIGGKLMFYSGLGLAILLLFFSNTIAFYIFISSIILMTLSMVYISYLIHKRVVENPK
jgi:uncharacterized membrane protein